MLLLLTRPFRMMLLITLFMFAVSLITSGLGQFMPQPQIILYTSQSAGFPSSPDNPIYLYDLRRGVDAPMLVNADALHPRPNRFDRIAYIVNTGNEFNLYVYEWDKPENTVQFVAECYENCGYFWSEDGKYLFYLTGTFQDGFHLMRWDGKTSIDLTPPIETPLNDIRYLSILPENQLIVEVSWGHGTETGSLSAIYLIDHESIYQLRQKPDSIYTLPQFDQPFLWNGIDLSFILSQWRPIPYVETRQERWSLDGSQVVVIDRPLVIIQDARQNTLHSHRGRVNSAAWTSDQDLLYCTAEEYTAPNGTIMSRYPRYHWNGHRLVQIEEAMHFYVWHPQLIPMGPTDFLMHCL